MRIGPINLYWPA